MRKIVTVRLPNQAFAVVALPPELTAIGLKAALDQPSWSVVKLHSFRPLGEMERIYDKVRNFDTIIIDLLPRLSLFPH